MAGLLDFMSPEARAAVDQYAQMDGLLAPERPQGFWQGGGKFGVKDGLAGLLAAAGDALMAQAGMQTGAVGGLVGGRMSALDDLKKQAAQEQKMRELIAIGQANGLSEGQVRMQAAGLEGPEPEKPPAIGQNLDYFMQNIKGNPEREAAFREYFSITRPPMTGGDGQLYPNVPSSPDAPDFLSDEDMAKLGGGTGNGAGGFRFR